MLGSQLKKLRKAKNIKQRQLAEYLNVSTGQLGYGNWITGLLTTKP